MNFITNFSEGAVKKALPEWRQEPFMNKSIGKARKLMSAQKVLERSDNKVLAIKTHATITYGGINVPQRDRVLVHQIRCA